MVPGIPEAVGHRVGGGILIEVGDDGRTLYIVANNYGASGASDGIVMIEQVDVPHAGRP